MIRIDEDAKLRGVYKIAALLPSLNNTPTSIKTQQVYQSPIPAMSKTPELSALHDIDDDIFYTPNSTTDKVSEDFSLFKEMEEEEEIDEYRVEAIKDMLTKVFGESIVKEDFNKNHKVSVNAVLQFCRKKGTEEMDYQTALLKAKSFLKIVHESLYTELMQQSDVLLNSLTTVNSLENSYRKISVNLEEINNHFITIRNSLSFYLTNSSVSFLRYKNLCEVQTYIERIKNSAKLMEEAEEINKKDHIEAYNHIKRAMKELKTMSKIQCSKQLLVKCNEIKKKIKEKIIVKQEMIQNIFNSIELSSKKTYEFDENSWMNEFEEERKIFTEVIVGFEKIKELKNLVESIDKLLQRVLTNLPYLTFPNYENGLFDDINIDIKDNQKFLNKLKELSFNDFRLYLVNLTNKTLHISCIIVMFQMSILLELEENKNAPKELIEKVNELINSIKQIIRTMFKIIIENGNYERITVEDIRQFSEVAKKFIYSMNVINKEKIKTLDDLHSIYLNKFFDSWHKNNTLKLKNILEFDDLSTIPIEEDIFNVINIIVTQIIIPPMTCNLGEKNNEDKSTTIIINNDNFFMTNTLSVLLPTLEKYREIVVTFPSLGERVIEHSKDLLLEYDTILRKLLLGKELIQKGVVQRIGARMFTVAHQSLLLLSILVPSLHRYLSPNFVISGRKLDGMEDKLKLHCEDIRKELTMIFRNRVAYYLQTLEQSKQQNIVQQSPRGNRIFGKSKTAVLASPQKTMNDTELKSLLVKIIGEIVSLNALLKKNLRTIDFKYCIFEESKHLNSLREDYDRRANNDDLKTQLSSDLHQISVALHDGLKTQKDDLTKVETSNIMNKFEIDEESEQKENGEEDDDDDEETLIIKRNTDIVKEEPEKPPTPEEE